MTERWLFEHLKKKKALVDDSAEEGNPFATTTVADKKKEPDKPSVMGGFWNHLVESADKQMAAGRQLESNSANREDRKDKRKKKR